MKTGFSIGEVRKADQTKWEATTSILNKKVRQVEEALFGEKTNDKTPKSTSTKKTAPKKVVLDIEQRFTPAPRGGRGEGRGGERRTEPCPDGLGEEVEGADAVGLLAAGGIEEGAVHVLPEALDELGVLADEAAGALFEHLLGTAFADPGDAGFGFDGDYEVALVEEGVGFGRCVVGDLPGGVVRHRRDLPGDDR